MIVYLDTSSLVKLYIEETGSDEINAIVGRATVVSTSMIAYAEARAAFAKKRKQAGFSAGILRRMVDALNQDWDNYLTIEVAGVLVRAAGEIAEKHLLRGFDSIHLASALALKSKTSSEVFFSSGDARLNQAAQKEGMTVL